MINILYVHQSAELYGSDRTLLSLVTKLNRSIYRPIVVLPGEGPLKEELQQAGIEIIVTPVIKLHRKMFNFKYLILLPLHIWRSVRTVKKKLNGLPIHIVQSNTLAVLLGVFLCWKFKSKHVWHVHEIIVNPAFISNLYPKLLSRFADVVVCNSMATLDNLLSRNPKLENKLRVIHNGLDPNDFPLAQANPEQFGFDKDDIVITLVGRISRLKGQQLLLKVFKEHLSENPKIKLLFAGAPVPGQEFYLTALEDKIIEYQLTTQVKIIGFQKSLAAVWAITTISVSPSTEAESFGLVALEAMFAKIPVVATNLGGLKEVIVHDETGFLFENKNETKLANYLKTLIETSNLRREMGEKGYARALSAFTMAAYIERFQQVYSEVVLLSDP